MNLTVIPLEEIDISEVLLCECILVNGLPCDRPAAVRITTRCDGCHRTISGWTCVPCWDYVRPQILFREWACRLCGARREIRTS